MIGAIGEILGAAGVIFTLAYLAVQIRQNTSALESTSSDYGYTQSNLVRLHISSSEEMTEIWMKGLSDPETLNPVQLERFRITFASILDVIGAQYQKRGLSLISQSSWAAAEASLNRFISSSGGKWYLNTHAEGLAPEYRKFIMGKMRDNS